jgi:hypothetical protein
MPCGSIEDALAWREVNVPPGLWRTGAASAGAMPPPAGEVGPALSDHARLLRAKASREEAEAAMAKARRLEQEGKTVSTDHLRIFFFEFARRIRDALMQIAARAAPLVAAESDQRACQRVIDAEVRRVLALLANAGPEPAAPAEASGNA